MPRDLRAVMRDTAARPQRDLDLEQLWRRGRRRRYLKRTGVAGAAIALVIGVAVVALPILRPAPPVVDEPPPGPPRILRSVDVSEPSAAVAAAGKVWVVGYRGALQAIDPADGRIVSHAVDTGSCGLGGGDALVVVFRCEDPLEPAGELVAVDPATGTVRWTSPVDGYVTATSHADDRVAVLAQAGRDGWIAILDARTGGELGRRVIERASVWSVVSEAGIAWITVTRQPDATSATRHVEIIAVDLTSMEVVGRHMVGEDHGGPQRLVIRDGQLWVPVEDGVAILDASTLREVRRIPVPIVTPGPGSAPAIAASPDHVWLVDGAGMIQVIDPGQGTPLDRVELGRLAVTQPPAVVGGALWVPDRADDRIVVIGW